MPSNILLGMSFAFFFFSYFIAEEGNWISALGSGVLFLIGVLHLVASIFIRYDLHERLVNHFIKEEEKNKNKNKNKD